MKHVVVLAILTMMLAGARCNQAPAPALVSGAIFGDTQYWPDCDETEGHPWCNQMFDVLGYLAATMGPNRLMVIQPGDFVDRCSTQLGRYQNNSQWWSAFSGLARHMLVVSGNHDRCQNFDLFFSRNWSVIVEPGDGVQWHVIGLQYRPTDHADAMAFFEQKMDEHAGIPTVLVTHAYLSAWLFDPDNPLPGSNGDLLRPFIEERCEIFWVISGHTWSHSKFMPNDCGTEYFAHAVNFQETEELGMNNAGETCWIGDRYGNIVEPWCTPDVYPSCVQWNLSNRGCGDGYVVLWTIFGRTLHFTTRTAYGDTEYLGTPRLDKPAGPYETHHKEVTFAAGRLGW